MTDIVELSEIDSQRYGVKIARSKHVTADNLADILAFCHAERVAMLIARCSTDSLQVAQQMEQHGFLLMDTLVYYEFKYAKSSIGEDIQNGFVLRRFREGDEVAVEQIARQAFNDYYGHYHADPRLDRQKSDEAYASWAIRSCLDRQVADEMLIADVDGVVAGFFAMQMLNPQDGTGVISGVAHAYRKLGIYRSFVINTLKWIQEQNGDRVVFSTQVNNIPVQKVWARLGFTMAQSSYTFHKWFDQ